MRDTLEDLYFGNITPNDQVVKSGTALKKAMEQSAECEEKLTALLEDKEKTYENSESWRRLLLAHQTELATAMKIPPSSFRWCAAFHDEKHHPHIHMMVWSADPKQGYLTEQGIETMRS